MNLKSTKGSAIWISVIMAVMITALFLVSKITVVFVTAYIFALIGIIAFCAGTIYMISSPKSYPWFAAFPIRIWQYLISELVLSAVFVLWGNISGNQLPIQWFVLLHIILMAVFAIPLVLMKAGKEIIEERDTEVKQKVAALRLMQVDMDSLARKFPAHEKDLRQVTDALRYSDPMVHSSLTVYDEQIQKGIMEINDLSGEDINRIPELCKTLLLKIADRNSRVKAMK